MGINYSQKRHNRRNCKKVINPWNVRGMFPIGREDDLLIEWDKDKLSYVYEEDKMKRKSECGVKGLSGEEFYNKAALGVKREDKYEKTKVVRKLPFNQLSSKERAETGAIKGGFIKDGRIIPYLFIFVDDRNRIDLKKIPKNIPEKYIKDIHPYYK